MSDDEIKQPQVVRSKPVPPVPPSKHTPEIEQAIVERLADGESLRSICRTEGFPNDRTVRDWIDQDRPPGIAARIQRARVAGYMAMADEILEISDDGRNDWMERLNYNGGTPELVPNGEHINRSRLRVDTRKWILTKMLPKVFGDSSRVELAADKSLADILQSREDKLRAARMLPDGDSPHDPNHDPQE